eukprot:SAG31_NODE_2880_length_4958_cov_4.413460_2_plen_111_part_00
MFERHHHVNPEADSCASAVPVGSPPAESVIFGTTHHSSVVVAPLKWSGRDVEHGLLATEQGGVAHDARVIGELPRRLAAEVRGSEYLGWRKQAAENQPACTGEARAASML